jgi:ferrous iron transport protein B
VVLAGLGVVIHRLPFAGSQSAFIMELPLYHMPNGRTIALFVWHNTVAFLRKAGTTILLFSVFIWMISALPNGDIDQSYLAMLGRALDPVGRALGWSDWRLSAALLSSFAAKENTITTLSILYHNGKEIGDLSQHVAAVLTPAAALAFLAVQMLFIPCAATVAVIRQETGSWLWSLLNIGLLLAISLGMGAGVYQLAMMMGLGAT